MHTLRIGPSIMPGTTGLTCTTNREHHTDVKAFLAQLHNPYADDEFKPLKAVKTSFMLVFMDEMVPPLKHSGVTTGGLMIAGKGDMYMVYRSDTGRFVAEAYVTPATDNRSFVPPGESAAVLRRGRLDG